MANTLTLFRQGGVGFIDWLGLVGKNRIIVTELKAFSEESRVHPIGFLLNFRSMSASPTGPNGMPSGTGSGVRSAAVTVTASSRATAMRCIDLMRIIRNFVIKDEHFFV